MLFISGRFGSYSTLLHFILHAKENFSMEVFGDPNVHELCPTCSIFNIYSVVQEYAWKTLLRTDFIYTREIDVYRDASTKLSFTA